MKDNKINAAFRINNLRELDATMFLAIAKLKEKIKDNTNYYINIEVYEELPEC
jgi:uncharacterized protein (UPF0212 family)